MKSWRNLRLRRPLIFWTFAIIAAVLLLENYQTLLYFKIKLFNPNAYVDELYYTNESEFSFKTFFDNTLVSSKPFEKNYNKYLRDLNLMDVKAFDDEIVLNSEPIIATAISSNHFRESLKMLKSVSVFYKRKIVYLYDLGLSPIHQFILQLFFGDLIIDIKRFQFENYPFYVSNLREFRWKPLVIAELLRVYPSLFWMDASIRIHAPLDKVYSRIRRCRSKVNDCDFYSWSLIADLRHSIYSATDKRMYIYFPINLDVSKNLTMWAATGQVIFGTRDVRENVLRYWVLCALEKECMNPTQSVIECKFGKDQYNQYAGCHRQDQSAINLILANVNNFKETRYYYDDKNVITIEKEKI